MKDRTVHPAPIYDVVGWVTENDAADIKTKLDPPERGKRVNRTTISRWRGDWYIQAIDINGSLVVVNLDQLKEFKGVPLGNPDVVSTPHPERAAKLPDTITITLKRRKKSRGS